MNPFFTIPLLISQAALCVFAGNTPSSPAATSSRKNQRHRNTEDAHYDQVPNYTRDEYSTARRTSRTRRTSYTTKPQPTPQKQRPTTSKPPPQATDANARRAGIPAGYSLENWDPTEEHILLVGSVFDANSLGKWIYDWTVDRHGPAAPMSEIAGELWLLLIQLAGKIKLAEQGLSTLRRQEHCEMIQDYLDSGKRLWERFSRLLKGCESYMLKAAQRDSLGKTLPMGQKSGHEFVDTMFGRDRELEHTKKLMTDIRPWSMRFDADCEKILCKT